MDHDYIQQALNAVAPDLLEEKIPVRFRRTLPRAARVGLAACLAVLLIGSALAATSIAGFDTFHQIRDHLDNGRNYNGYSLTGGAIVFYPADELSQQARELAHSNPGSTVTLPIADRDEFAQFTGIELPELMIPSSLRHLSSHGSLYCDETDPTILVLQDSYLGVNDPTLRLSIESTVFTERMYSADRPLFVNYYFPDSCVYSTEEYINGNGFSLLLTKCIYPENAPQALHNGTQHYIADFIHDGVRFHLQATCQTDPAAALNALTDILESISH